MAKIMKISKYSWGLVGTSRGWSSQWEQVGLWVIWQMGAFEWL